MERGNKKVSGEVLAYESGGRRRIQKKHVGEKKKTGGHG